MTERKGKRLGFRLLLLAAAIAAILMACAPVCAATYKNQWVKKSGKYYYYNKKGKTLKGLQKIGDKYYYFDSKGVQRVGWRKIEGIYYCFAFSNGAKGSMYTSTKRNGIKLGKTGKASISSNTVLRKAILMTRAQLIVDSITKPSDSKATKLWKCFQYAMNQTPRTRGGFYEGSDWDMYYAEFMMDYGYGDCYSFGALFAYLANAAGYKNVCVESSGGHGWAQIGGLYYDPNWARVIGADKCYGVPSYLSGYDGRPDWARYGIFQKNLSK